MVTATRPGRQIRGGVQREPADDVGVREHSLRSLDRAHPVLHDDHRDAAEELRAAQHRRFGILHLGGHERQLRRPGQSLRRRDLRLYRTPRAVQAQPAGAQRPKIVAAGGDLDLVPAPKQQRGDRAADGARAENRHLHAWNPTVSPAPHRHADTLSVCQRTIPTAHPAGPSRRSGILLVDKPAGFTSHDVVARTRRLAGTRKVGHAGTLDPMATGLLILGLNSSTRLLTYLVGLDKEYYATIRLGASTTTDDAEGELVAAAAPEAVAAITDATARRAAGAPHRPHPAGALERQRDQSRRQAGLCAGAGGGELSRSPRGRSRSPHSSCSQQRSEPGHLDLDVRVECSSGTYIRALARDLGAALGVGGHLVALRRTRIGPFGIADAAPLADLDPAVRLIAPRRRRGGAVPHPDARRRPGHRPHARQEDRGRPARRRGPDPDCRARPGRQAGRPGHRLRHHREAAGQLPERRGADVIEWFAYLQVAIAVLAGTFCLVMGLLGKTPNDYTLGSLLIVEVLLIVQLVVAIVAPLVGNVASGNVLEFYTYLISALLLVPAAGFWALIERDRWSTVVLGVIGLSAAVMLYRMYQIWTAQVA